MSLLGSYHGRCRRCRCNQTRSCRAPDTAPETELPVYPSTNTFKFPRFGRSYHHLTEDTGFVLGPSTTPPFTCLPVSCEPSDLTRPYHNALRVSNTIRLWTVLVLQDTERSFREGVPFFGSATRPTLGRASIARFSSPTVRSRWSRECHRKDGGAMLLLSLTRRYLAHRMPV